MYLLLANSKKRSLNPKIRLAFPWVLWQIWKARNLFCFEQRRFNAEAVIDKAMEEAAVWLHLHSFIPDDSPEITVEEMASQSWEKPPLGSFKCNMSTVWEAQTGNAGAAWIIRDSFGKALFHSRRSFVGIRSQVEATMIVLVWTTEALNDIQVKRIILETSSPQIQKNFSQASLPWSLHSLWRRFRRALDRLETYRVVRINDGCNTIAQNIAESALQVQWQQSYLARNGLDWLDARINMEASVVV
ncbi:hypothetical protein F2Q69_00026277 [Brassica cretica]|uniref:RNase H type-1 domain-containing protein n=1 Tax=Brassica cretica TaxID=69181 RepID=A0A8S9S1F4_BRACR|nr:hypothetical protein F2Q69_00026277 [Brassica cretica]